MHRESVTTRTARAVMLPSLLVLVLVGAGARPASPQTLGTVSVVVLGYRAPASTVVPDEEVELLAMMNEIRTARRLPPLLMSAALRTVARDHSRDMALSGYVGHDSPQGQSFLTRLSNVVLRGTVVGENVTAALTVEQAHNAFIHSPGHLKNILDPEFRSVGVGIATAGAVGFMVTEDFSQ
ncbi:MAG TPA: CAP domain-containing protein [bacterium]|nr:CAP domain-containing protein [bacterium]